MSVKAVKTLALTGGVTAKVVSASVASGEQTEAINVTTLDDTKMIKVLRLQKKKTDITLMCEYAGALAGATGTLATLTVTPTDDAGVAHAASVYGYIKSSIPQETAVDGERRMLQQVIFTPTGTAEP
jgi:hypothetical protein